MDHSEILLYEELQTNAFPALQTVMYDGWSVRFGGGFTYRVNCANPMYPEALPGAEKVRYVEQLYRDSGLSKSIVKLHDGMDPAQLAVCAQALDELGYGTERSGNIFVCPLESFTRIPNTETIIDSAMTGPWLDGFLTVNGTADAQRDAAVKMLQNIAYPIAAASIEENGRMIACGLGVLERGYVGLYDIYVDASCRRRGLGGDICTAIMQYGKSMGCHTAYLQCLTDNLGARALYDLLGYHETYHYWFRTKSLTE